MAHGYVGIVDFGRPVLLLGLDSGHHAGFGRRTWHGYQRFGAGGGQAAPHVIRKRGVVIFYYEVVVQPELGRLEAEPVEEGLSVGVVLPDQQRNAAGATALGQGQQQLALGDVRLLEGPQEFAAAHRGDVLTYHRFG